MIPRLNPSRPAGAVLLDPVPTGVSRRPVSGFDAFRPDPDGPAHRPQETRRVLVVLADALDRLDATTDDSTRELADALRPILVRQCLTSLADLWGVAEPVVAALVPTDRAALRDPSTQHDIIDLLACGPTAAEAHAWTTDRPDPETITVLRALRARPGEDPTV